MNRKSFKTKNSRFRSNSYHWFEEAHDKSQQNNYDDDEYIIKPERSNSEEIVQLENKPDYNNSIPFNFHN